MARRKPRLPLLQREPVDCERKQGWGLGQKNPLTWIIAGFRLATHRRTLSFIGMYPRETIRLYARICVSRASLWAAWNRQVRVDASSCIGRITVAFSSRHLYLVPLGLRSNAGPSTRGGGGCL